MRECSLDECGRAALAKGMCQYHYYRLRRYGDSTTRPTTIICADCGATHPVPVTGTVPAVCADCGVVRHRSRMRSQRWEKGLRESYGITPDEYWLLSDVQGGLCAICKGQPNGRGRQNERFAVDHDHETGKVRGLLCSTCNTGIGLLRDDPELLRAAINYLEKTNG